MTKQRHIEGWQIEGPWPGKLYIVPRPRGGEWLMDEINKWSEAGIDVLVSLLDRNEIDQLELQNEASAVKGADIEWISCPISDRDVPESGCFADLVSQLSSLLSIGRQVAIHCRQGIGRSG